MKILIVDDEGIVCDVLSAILTDNGFDVQTAASGQQGLEILAQTPTDFLITDFLMPHMSGVELLEEATRISPGIKVILMSGHVDFDGSIAESAGNAYAVLHKPFDFRELMDLLAKGAPAPSPES
jgi:DNA-binding NtrC family response regulator